MHYRDIETFLSCAPWESIYSYSINKLLQAFGSRIKIERVEHQLVPTSMMGSISECQPFDIIVVGAGIAGLAAAAALIQQGHHVKIIEAAPELQEIGAGIQVPPNSVRVLHHLGVFEEVGENDHDHCDD